jgi:hypothetical protein
MLPARHPLVIVGRSGRPYVVPDRRRTAPAGQRDRDGWFGPLVRQWCRIGADAYVLGSTSSEMRSMKKRTVERVTRGACFTAITLAAALLLGVTAAAAGPADPRKACDLSGTWYGGLHRVAAHDQPHGRGQLRLVGPAVPEMGGFRRLQRDRLQRPHREIRPQLQRLRYGYVPIDGGRHHRGRQGPVRRVSGPRHHRPGGRSPRGNLPSSPVARSHLRELPERRQDRLARRARATGLASAGKEIAHGRAAVQAESAEALDHHQVGRSRPRRSSRCPTARRRPCRASTAD